MKPEDGVPIVCALSEEQLRQRRATLLSRFRSIVTATHELENGYEFRIRGNAAAIMAAAELIAAERECCRFLTFELKIESAMNEATVRVTGPPGAREFWMNLLS
jgi:hypothetical protein